MTSALIWATASSCLLPAFGFHAKLFVFINFSWQSPQQNFYHPFMDSVLFFSTCVEIFPYIHLLFCLCFPFWSLLKGLWAYAFAFGGGSWYRYPRSDPRPNFGFGARQVFMSHILRGRFGSVFCMMTRLTCQNPRAEAQH